MRAIYNVFIANPAFQDINKVELLPSFSCMIKYSLVSKRLISLISKSIVSKNSAPLKLTLNLLNTFHHENDEASSIVYYSFLIKI